jgi:hypothetical protein
MTKLEFISFAFPYGLKMFGIKSADDIEREDYILNVYSIDKEDCYCGNHNRIIGKPIFRPLSEVQNKIEHKGETFIPAYKLAEMGWSVPAILFYPHSVIDQNTLPVFVFQKLVEWHFDIIGLIDKNEAINYSTLEGFSF